MYHRELWKDTDVRCPFYISDDTGMRSISCEGFDDGVKTRTHFRTIEMKNNHMGRYCVSRYASCPVYKCTVENRYGETEEKL